MNLAYDFKTGMWLALGVRQTAAGKTTVNRVQKDDPTVNNRIGAVFGIPVARRHTLRLLATTGTTATKGNDYNTLAVGWFVNW